MYHTGRYGICYCLHAGNNVPYREIRYVIAYMQATMYHTGRYGICHCLHAGNNVPYWEIQYLILLTCRQQCTTQGDMVSVIAYMLATMCHTGRYGICHCLHAGNNVPYREIQYLSLLTSYHTWRRSIRHCLPKRLDPKLLT